MPFKHAQFIVWKLHLNNANFKKKKTAAKSNFILSSWQNDKN